MKRIRLFILTIVMMLFFSGNATAEEIKFTVPDINSQLNTMVEAKMDALIKEIYEKRGFTRDIEHLDNYMEKLPTAMKKKYGYDVKENRS